MGWNRDSGRGLRLSFWKQRHPLCVLPMTSSPQHIFLLHLPLSSWLMCIFSFLTLPGFWFPPFACFLAQSVPSLVLKMLVSYRATFSCYLEHLIMPLSQIHPHKLSLYNPFLAHCFSSTCSHFPHMEGGEILEQYRRRSCSACVKQSKHTDRWTVPATHSRDKRIEPAACCCCGSCHNS